MLNIKSWKLTGFKLTNSNMKKCLQLSNLTKFSTYKPYLYSTYLFCKGTCIINIVKNLHLWDIKDAFPVSKKENAII